MSLLLLFPSGGGAPSAITGTGAVTEAGSDIASASGGVRVAGTAGTSESGTDTAAASGDVVVQGSSAAAESGQDTGASSGAVLVQGALASSESGQDSAGVSGAVLVQGSASAAEMGEDVAAAGGGATSVITGSAALTESSEDTASGEGSSGEVAPSNRPGFEMGGRKIYIKRGKRIHIFDTVEDADSWVEAEEQAQQAIQTAKGKKKVKAKAKVYKALDEQLPHEVIRLDWLESLIDRFNIPIELPTLEARQDWLEVARIALLAKQLQDDEEVELLLLA